MERPAVLTLSPEPPLKRPKISPGLLRGVTHPIVPVANPHNGHGPSQAHHLAHELSSEMCLEEDFGEQGML
eukprot:scaffold497440_cov43-Prasinocladus_malaysianus.AAC.1